MVDWQTATAPVEIAHPCAQARVASVLVGMASGLGSSELIAPLVSGHLTCFNISTIPLNCFELSPGDTRCSPVPFSHLSPLSFLDIR